MEWRHFPTDLTHASPVWIYLEGIFQAEKKWNLWTDLLLHPVNEAGAQPPFLSILSLSPAACQLESCISRLLLKYVAAISLQSFKPPLLKKKKNEDWHCVLWAKVIPQDKSMCSASAVGSVTQKSFLHIPLHVFFCCFSIYTCHLFNSLCCIFHFSPTTLT